MGIRRALYLSHGGGPLPLLGDPAHNEMVACLQEIAREIQRPKAILMVSAHWEAPCATVTTSPDSHLIYDYHGFPRRIVCPYLRLPNGGGFGTSGYAAS